MIEVDSFPKGKSFVAIWFVRGNQELFSASLHYQSDGQYYAYDHTTDEFIPECDHGYDEQFFTEVNASYFIVD